MLVVLKIPIVYLCVVVWLAVRDDPARGEPDAPVRTVVPPQPDDAPAWRPPRSRVRVGSRPPRRPLSRRPATLRAEARR